MENKEIASSGQPAGMTQGEARKKAKELGGIAIGAKPGSKGNWLIGGWPHQQTTWVVVSQDYSRILAD